MGRKEFHYKYMTRIRLEHNYKIQRPENVRLYAISSQ